MTLPKLIAEVEKLSIETKPLVLSKLKSAAAILAQHSEAKHLLVEASAPKPDPKPAKPATKSVVKPGSDMPVGG